jgi:hypothetical protein
MKFLGAWFVFAALEVPFAYMMVNSKNQLPWMIALFAYCALAGLIVSNWSVFFSGERTFTKGVVSLVLNWVVVLAATVGYLIFVA